MSLKRSAHWELDAGEEGEGDKRVAEGDKGLEAGRQAPGPGQRKASRSRRQSSPTLALSKISTTSTAPVGDFAASGITEQSLLTPHRPRISLGFPHSGAISSRKSEEDGLLDSHSPQIPPQSTDQLSRPLPIRARSSSSSAAHSVGLGSESSLEMVLDGEDGSSSPYMHGFEEGDRTTSSITANGMSRPLPPPFSVSPLERGVHRLHVRSQGRLEAADLEGTARALENEPSISASSSAAMTTPPPSYTSLPTESASRAEDMDHSAPGSPNDEKATDKRSAPSSPDSGPSTQSSGRGLVLPDPSAFEASSSSDPSSLFHAAGSPSVAVSPSRNPGLACPPSPTRSPPGRGLRGSRLSWREDSQHVSHDREVEDAGFTRSSDREYDASSSSGIKSSGRRSRGHRATGAVARLFSPSNMSMTDDDVDDRDGIDDDDDGGGDDVGGSGHRVGEEEMERGKEESYRASGGESSGGVEGRGSDMDAEGVEDDRRLGVGSTHNPRVLLPPLTPGASMMQDGPQGSSAGTPRGSGGGRKRLLFGGMDGTATTTAAATSPRLTRRLWGASPPPPHHRHHPHAAPTPARPSATSKRTPSAIRKLDGASVLNAGAASVDRARSFGQRHRFSSRRYPRWPSGPTAISTTASDSLTSPPARTPPSTTPTSSSSSSSALRSKLRLPGHSPPARQSSSPEPFPRPAEEMDDCLGPQPISFAKSFEDLGTLGRGAFSVVHVARCLGASSLVPMFCAVKRALRPSHSRRERWRKLREFRLERAAGKHRNLVHYLGAWAEDNEGNPGGNNICFALRLCAGGSLASLAHRVARGELHLATAKSVTLPPPSTSKPRRHRSALPKSSSSSLHQHQHHHHHHHRPIHVFPEDTVWAFIGAVAAALEHLHDAGIVHLDVKPGNTLIADDGTLLLGDLGAARRFHPGLCGGHKTSSGKGERGDDRSEKSGDVTSREHPTTVFLAGRRMRPRPIEVVAASPPPPNKHPRSERGGWPWHSRLYKEEEEEEEEEEGEAEEGGDGGMAGEVGVDDEGESGAIGGYDSDGANSEPEEGDARYLAPELLAGGISGACPPADIFSLGVGAFELAWGLEAPADGDAWQALRHDRLPLLPDEIDHPRSSELLNTVRAMLSPDPSARPSAKDLLALPQVKPFLQSPDALLASIAPVIAKDLMSSFTAPVAARLGRAPSFSSAIQAAIDDQECDTKVGGGSGGGGGEEEGLRIADVDLDVKERVEEEEEEVEVVEEGEVDAGFIHPKSEEDVGDTATTAAAAASACTPGVIHTAPGPLRRTRSRTNTMSARRAHREAQKRALTPPESRDSSAMVARSASKDAAQRRSAIRAARINARRKGSAGRRSTTPFSPKVPIVLAGTRVQDTSSSSTASTSATTPRELHLPAIARPRPTGAFAPVPTTTTTGPRIKLPTTSSGASSSSATPSADVGGFITPKTHPSYPQW